MFEVILKGLKFGFRDGWFVILKMELFYDWNFVFECFDEDGSEMIMCDEFLGIVFDFLVVDWN